MSSVVPSALYCLRIIGTGVALRLPLPVVCSPFGTSFNGFKLIVDYGVHLLVGCRGRNTPKG